LREDDLKFFADECCDTEMVASLRIEGHDVLYVLNIDKFRFRPLLFETPSR